MNTELSTLPKPFVFVLMPIAPKFADIYKFGIKGAAEDAGAYAERVDEQIFTEGILDRIFNQISKADVVVADMTGRNPNVFYEVGYAHALGKTVLLLTHETDDIPFDLKHRQHTVYGGSIEVLRKELSQKIQWAISESKKKLSPGAIERFSIRIFGSDVPRIGLSTDLPVVSGRAVQSYFTLPLQIRNDSAETVLGITHLYLFTQQNAPVIPAKIETRYIAGTPNALTSFTLDNIQSYYSPPEPIRSAVASEPLEANPVDAQDGLLDQYRLMNIAFPALPPGAVEMSHLSMIFREGETSCNALYRLRLHSPSQYHDYPFRLELEFVEESPVETEEEESDQETGDESESEK